MTRQLADIAPNKTDRILIVGQTGSGKTTLAQFLLQQRKYVVVFDVKGTLNWPGYVRVTTVEKASKLDPVRFPRIIYRPAFRELNDASAIDSLFQWVYERHNTTLYVDEVAGVTRNDFFPYHYGACLMRGRELGVEVWSSTQRPTRIPIITMSEAEHCYCFFLRMAQDRTRIESQTGIDQESITTLPKRWFIYARQDGDIVGPLTLQISRGSDAHSEQLVNPVRRIHHG